MQKDSTLAPRAQNFPDKMGTVLMRFAWVMAAMAALWVQPAQAVTILLTAPDPALGVHQKITVTGLGPTNVIKAATGGDLTGYWREPLGGGLWYLNGNTVGILDCSATGSFGSCHDDTKVLGVGYPAKGFGSVSITIANDTVFVDWAKIANFACGPVDPNRDGVMNFCGFAWEHNIGGLATLGINLDVLGPATDWNYSVETLGTMAVPEPATWALMMLGIGMAGIGLRRRHVRVTAFDATHPLHPPTAF